MRNYLQNNLRISLLKISLVAIIFIGSITKLSAQHYMVLNEWRKYKHELGYSFGFSNFLGDLGGRDQIGSDFLWDLEFSLFKPAHILTYRFYMARNFVMRNTFSYGTVGGDDKLTAEKFRNNRNLNFKSRIFEYSLTFEYQIMTQNDHRRHNLRNNRGRKMGWKFNSWGIYLLGGVGGFYYNPKGLYYGQWIDLYPLHTEGQGLDGGPRQYKKFSVSIPVGGGFRYMINKQLSLNLEITHHFTFTDYIDDVSTVYHDNAAITNAYGAIAGYMADPSLGVLTQPLGYNPTNRGFQRGDETDKDGYLFTTLGLSYKFRNHYRPPGSSMKGKRSRSRAIF